MPTRTKPTKKFPEGRWCTNRIGGRTFTFDTEEQARAYEVEAKRRISEGRSLPEPSITTSRSELGSVIDSWDRYHRVNPRTKVGYRSHTNSFLEFWTPATPIHGIDAKQIREYWVHQQSTGLSPATINLRRTVLGMVLAFAKDEGLIDEFPRLPKRLRVGQTRLRFLTLDEERRLISEMPQEHWKNLTRFMIYTGLRVSEALSVRPMDRTNEGMQILGKGEKVRTVPLSDTALSALPSGVYYEQRYFPHTYAAYNKIFNAACERAGLQDVQIHTLRHTCFSRLAMKNISVTKIQALAGHSSITTTQRYMHLAPDYLEEVAEAIG